MTANALLVAVCVAGIAGAGVMAVRWGGLRYDPRAPVRAMEAESAGEAVLRALRAVAIGVTAGAIAGVLVGGLGGRLMMRVMAATSGRAAQGAITEADEVVGRVTAEGTIALVIFGGLFLGMAGGIVYVAIRRWLPQPAWLGGLTYGFLVIGMTRPIDLLDPGNVDFAILSPKALALGLILAIPFFYGVVVAALAERLDRNYPLLGSRPRAIAAYLPMIVFAMPFSAPFLIVILAAAAALHRLEPVRRWFRSPAADRTGRAVLGLAGLAGTAWIAASVVDILAV